MSQCCDPTILINTSTLCPRKVYRIYARDYVLYRVPKIISASRTHARVFSETVRSTVIVYRDYLYSLDHIYLYRRYLLSAYIFLAFLVTMRFCCLLEMLYILLRILTC